MITSWSYCAVCEQWWRADAEDSAALARVRHDCPAAMPEDPFGEILGVALHDSIEDPETGERWVTIQLF